MNADDASWLTSSAAKPPPRVYGRGKFGAASAVTNIIPAVPITLPALPPRARIALGDEDAAPPPAPSLLHVLQGAIALFPSSASVASSSSVRSKRPVGKARLAARLQLAGADGPPPPPPIAPPLSVKGSSAVAEQPAVAEQRSLDAAPLPALPAPAPNLSAPAAVITPLPSEPISVPLPLPSQRTPDSDDSGDEDSLGGVASLRMVAHSAAALHTAFRRVSLAPSAMRRTSSLLYPSVSCRTSTSSALLLGGVTVRTHSRMLGGPPRHVAEARLRGAVDTDALPFQSALPSFAEGDADSEEEGVGAADVSAPTLVSSLARLSLSANAVTVPAAAASPPPPSSPPLPPSSIAAAFACALVAVLEFVPSRDLLITAPAVSTAWATAAAHVFSWRVASGMDTAGLADDCIRESLTRSVVSPPRGGSSESNAPRAATRGGSRSRAVRNAPALPARVVPTRRGGSDAASVISPPLAPPLLSAWAPFLAAFPRGSFLAAGAYKQVFRVWCAALSRWEAVSVMDAGALSRVGSLSIVRAEIQVGCLLSQLVRTRVCPLFVETLQVFLHAASPQLHFPRHWGEGGDARASAPPTAPPSTRSSSRTGAKSSARSAAPLIVATPLHFTPATAAAHGLPPLGAFLYIRSELCTGSDAEARLREVEPLISSAEAAAAAASGAAAAASEAVVGGIKKKSGGLKGGSASRATVPTPPSPAMALLSAVDTAGARFATSVLWQLCFALYAARERVCLRHFDVKLLNVFLTDVAQDARVRCALGDLSFEVPLGGVGASPPSTCFDDGDDALTALARGTLVKLADYGTAVTDPETLGEPAGSLVWTTLENAPPEAFILGDAAVGGWGADTWALGLCALHLLTGAAPYEEVLEHAKCPRSLRNALVRVWLGGKGARKRRGGKRGGDGASPSYSEVQWLLESGKDEDENECTGDVLADTLWRYAVLLGVPPIRHASPFRSDNPVWALICSVACDDPPEPPSCWEDGDDALADVRATFERDASSYSVARGTHPLLMRLRRRLSAGEGLEALVFGRGGGALLSWHPDSRPTMRAALVAPAFHHLHVAPGGIGWEEEGDPLRSTFYRRDVADV